MKAATVSFPLSVIVVAGDLRGATAALTAALTVPKGALLAALFSAAPRGWTLTVTDLTAGAVAMGGERDARYTHGDGRSVAINVMLDTL